MADDVMAALYGNALLQVAFRAATLDTVIPCRA